MAAYLKITGQALLEVFGRLPDAPRGAKSVEPGTEVCFRTVTKKIYDPLLYGKVNKRNCPKVESKTEYWVRKKRATKTGDLIRVLTKRGKDVGCVTDAEFFTRKYINGKLVRVELLTMIADKNGSRKKKTKGSIRSASSAARTAGPPTTRAALLRGRSTAGRRLPTTRPSGRKGGRATT